MIRTYDTSLWKWDDVNKKRTSNGTMNMIPLWDDASDYAKNGNWNEPLRASLEKSYTAKVMPRKFGMWVYSGDENNDGISDNKNCMLTAVFCTKCGGPSDYGISKSLNMTGSMDWISWKYLEADIPQDWAMPIVFNYFWMSNTNCSLTPAQNYKTSVLVDDLKYIYSDESRIFPGRCFPQPRPKQAGSIKASWISPQLLPTRCLV